MSLCLTIPVYVDHHRNEAGHAHFRVRPLFVPEWDEDEHDAREDRALKRLSDALARSLSEMATGPDHRSLLPWTFGPPASGHAIKLRIDLRKKSFEGRFFVAVFEGAGRRLALLPRGGGLTFEWPAGVPLEEELRRVLTEHLRRLEKEAEEEFDPASWLCAGQPHLTHVTVVVSGSQRLPSRPSLKQALGEEEEMDGGKELRKVGRCLDALYPNDLQHAVLREEEVKELLSWFGPKRGHVPMVLLVGRSKAGKTALVHECLRRRIETPEIKKRGQFWQVSPQRVISGMSYVGQWEQRWTAMLAEMRSQRHVLVLDDVLGLFEAGRSSGSDLSLGHVLKARQEHEPVAILAETTPEGWGRLRETDRAFASMFQVIHVREMDDENSLRILIRTLQRMETQSQVRLAPEILPLTLRLQTRFGRGRAFPGKGVEMLTALASSFAGRAAASREAAVGSAEVLRWFAERNGIRLAMIDSSQPLTAADLQKFFASRIMGQEEAVQAMTDTVLMARAQVNDERKPLASLLFLGPTGVGKTECARALAEFVFGSEERMLRFDLNEYSGGDAALRLIGSPGQSGLLTSRVRRQPFSLLLFDEVEKAHPDVFDLLLQVLGEGRLTDAQGQTVDFCNCLIILTSNLGAQKTRRSLGFGQTGHGQEAPEAYREAAEKFFRPEFFNRLDRLVPFHELRKQDIERLAGTLSARALERQGLRDRRVEVKLDAAATAWLAARGYDPEYGARALRRAIETHLVEPLAVQMTGWPASRALRVYTTLRDQALHFEPEIHRQAAQTASLPAQLSHEERLAALDEAHQCLDETGDRLDGWEMKEEGLSGLRAWYYRLRDEANAVRQQLEQAEASFEAMEKARRKMAGSRGTKPFVEPVDGQMKVLPDDSLASLLDSLLGQDLSYRTVTARLDLAVPVTRPTATALRLLWRARRVLALAEPAWQVPVSCTLEGASASWLAPWAKDPFVDGLQDAGGHAVLIEGHGVQAMAASVAGVHASFEDALHLHAVKVAGQPGEAAARSGEVTHIRYGSMLLDLRTGLCADTEDGVPAEFALAYGHSVSPPTPG